MTKRKFCGAVTVAAALILSLSAQAQLTPYSQDFEGLDMTAPDALANDGWLIFGNVYDGDGNFKFPYGVFTAPNGGPGFSAIDSGQGGPGQGAQQLSVYNDYNCCGLGTGSPEGHGNGTDQVESNVFQEQTIGAGDVGSTWTFSFEYKAGTIDDTDNSTTAAAFIKTLDPSAGFATTNFLTVDTTNAPVDWTGDSISIFIDTGLAGQRLQIGFVSTASNFEPSGVFYDNLGFAQAVDDSDDDGIPDSTDNCTEVPNPGQQDTNGDGFGNACDADLNNDCIVNFDDLTALKAVFFSNDPDADFDSSGTVNFDDLTVMKNSFFGQPGPSAQASCDL